MRNELDRLLALRVALFSKDSPWGTSGLTFPDNYCRMLNVSVNFLHLVPELAHYLREQILSQIEDALDEYTWLAPWDRRGSWPLSAALLIFAGGIPNRADAFKFTPRPIYSRAILTIG